MHNGDVESVPSREHLDSIIAAAFVLFAGVYLMFAYGSDAGGCLFDVLSSEEGSMSGLCNCFFAYTTVETSEQRHQAPSVDNL